MDSTINHKKIKKVSSFLAREERKRKQTRHEEGNRKTRRIKKQREKTPVNG